MRISTRYDEAKVIIAEIDNMVISVNDTPEEMRSMCSELRSKWNSIPTYGVCSRRTHSLRDQLDRADAGSWQIADGGATRKAAAGGTSVGDLRVRIVVEP
jgi:hypothetical protein